MSIILEWQNNSTSNQHDFEFKKTSTILVKFGKMFKGNPNFKKKVYYFGLAVLKIRIVQF